MAKKVRGLSSLFIPSLNIVLNYNDVIDIKDDKLAESLQDQGLVDILIEEPSSATKKPKRRSTKKEPVKDVVEDDDK